MIIRVVCYPQLVKAFRILNLGHIYQHFSEHYYAHHLKTPKGRMKGKEKKDHHFFVFVFLIGNRSFIEKSTSRTVTQDPQLSFRSHCIQLYVMTTSTNWIFEI